MVLNQPGSKPVTPERTERGAIAAEYGIILALVGLALVGALVYFSDALGGVLRSAADTMAGH